jgi:hypothetical protein
MCEETGTCPRRKKLGGRDLCFLLHRNEVYASKNEEEKVKEETEREMTSRNSNRKLRKEMGIMRSWPYSYLTLIRAL